MLDRNKFPLVSAIASDVAHPAREEAELLLATAEGAGDVLESLPSLLNSVIVYQMSRIE